MCLLFLFGASTLHAAYILTQVGSGTIATTAAGTNTPVNFTTGQQAGMQVNRSASGFGSHTTVTEGVYFTYSFTASVAGSNPLFAKFDAQNQMGGIWSGWGSDDNGPWQRGPTTSTWSRGTRYQHVYPGGTATSTVTLVGGLPSADPSVTLNSSLLRPAVGDLLSVAVYLNAVDNTILSVYRNETTGEFFSYTVLNPGIPGGNLAFGNIQFRSDANISAFNYTFGTLVVPEPRRAALLITGIALGIMVRRRK